MRRNLWIILIVASFLVVYWASLTLIYIEGDDAHSIIYHALDRDADLVSLFVPYHSMMDAVLGLLPPREALLRPLVMLTTSVAAVLMVIFECAIVFEWLGDTTSSSKWILVLVVLLAIPEFLYLGLVYLPSVIAMALVTGAHLLLRRTLRSAGDGDVLSLWKRAGLPISAILYGIGSACRWEISVYGAVIAADLFFVMSQGPAPVIRPLRRRLMLTLTWGTVAVLAAFGAIAISGYGPAEALAAAQEFLGPNKAPDSSEIGLLRMVAGLTSSLFTPPFLLLAIPGFIFLLVRRPPLAIAISINLIIVILVTPWRSEAAAPKHLLAAMPSFITCTIAGFELLWHGLKVPLLRYAVRFAILIALAGNWLVGIHVESTSAWGPGFEQQPYDRPAQAENLRFAIAPGAGLALPLSEGPRPFFGHAQVLFGGLWRAMVTHRYREQQNSVRVAVAENLPLLRVERQVPGVAVLVEMGYTLASATEHGLLREWRFLNETTGSYHTTLALFEWDQLYMREGIERIRQIAGSDKVIVYGYSAEMRKLYEFNPGALQKLDLISAVLDLKLLQEHASAERRK